MSARKEQISKERIGRHENHIGTLDHGEIDLVDYVPEGVEAIVPYKGAAVNVIRRLSGGLKSGMSYCGAKSLAELRSNGEFIRITDVGVKESMPHDVKEL